MKTLADWLAHLEKLHPRGQAGIELGLDRVEQVRNVLRQEAHCPLIVVGGTNGKGSTCAYLEAIYTFAGYRVGCYTSPHLLAYNERVRIGRAPINDAALCRAFARVESARQAAGNVALTYFEFGTLAAWEAFYESRVEVMILEVGLGGRLDAVNVYDADCAVVTGIALDHTDWLGATREAIGFEKAGIFRSGRLAVCADGAPPNSLLEHAVALDAGLHLIGRDFSFARNSDGWSFSAPGGALDALPWPALRGEFQLANAAAVLQTVLLLRGRLPVPVAAIRRGLCEMELPGRFQVLPRQPGMPTVVLDVAHNPQALAALADNLQRMGTFARTFAVLGMLADKDIAGALPVLAGKIDTWLLTSLEGPRAASCVTLAQIVKQCHLGGAVEQFAAPDAAFARAAKLAGENDRIVVFGSFHTVAAVMRTLQCRAGA